MKNTNTNTRKKITNQPNNKTIVKRWTEDYTKEIKKLENKKNLTKEEEKLINKLKKQRKEQISNLKKQYKLYNCNINCKNTLLEPGPPNQVPKSMQKEFHNSKKLIKIFSKRRKDIFKNKRNVLIDNFYEKTSELDKKNF